MILTLFLGKGSLLIGKLKKKKKSTTSKGGKGPLFVQGYHSERESVLSFQEKNLTGREKKRKEGSSYSGKICMQKDLQ